MAFGSLHSSLPLPETTVRGCLKALTDSFDYTRAAAAAAQVMKKKVSFAHIHVRSFPVVIGDHPFCRTGCPTTLGWGHSKEERMNIDDYESAKQQRSLNNNKNGTVEVPAVRCSSKDERRQQLLAGSFSEWDLQRGERNVYLDRRRRRRSQIARRFMTT